MAVNGSALKAFRESKNLSQAAFAKLIGTDPATVSNLEHGRHKIGPSTLTKYRKAGFRPPGRPPASIPIPEKTDVDTVLLAEKILRQHAPHLLSKSDPVAAALDQLSRIVIGREDDLDKRIDAIHGSLGTRLEAVERELMHVGQILRRIEVLSSPLLPPGNSEQSAENGPENPTE